MNANAKNKWTHHSTLLSILLALSVLVNVFLARKVQVQTNSTKAAEALQVGLGVPPIVGRSQDGTEETLRYADSKLPTVLYVFTPQCGWCKKNISNLHVLINSSGVRYRIVGVSLTTQGLKKYLIDNDLSMPVYADLDVSLAEKYKFTGTPMTVVISPASKVLKVWMGVYTDHTRQDINKYLQVDLPGCCSD